MHLYRGCACLNCRYLSSSPSKPTLIPTRCSDGCNSFRKRKVKCDGRRPICKACLTFSPEECQYADGALSEDQSLESEIESMENRLRRLQNPGELPMTFRDSMSLHSPYSTTSSTSSLRRGLKFRDAPPAIRRKWLHTFISHAPVFGFFLANSKLETQQPSPPLLSAAYLLGALLTRVQDTASYEQDLLATTLHETAQGLAGAHPDRLLQTIQAEVLVANYFFLYGRALEGKYHVTAAVSLVLGAGFHKIGSSQQQALPRLGLDAPLSLESVAKEIENIRALWMVLIMNHCWTSADGAASYIAYDHPESRIDAPWPVDIEYQPSQVLSLRGSDTIEKFLRGNPDDGISLLALHAKAAILFEQASFLHRQYRPNMSLKDATRFQSSFNNLDSLIRRFISKLPPIISSSRPIVLRRLMLINTLARVSLIQMHYTFSAHDMSSRSLILTTAESIVLALRNTVLDDFPSIDPIMATLWGATAKVFIEEIVASRDSSLQSGLHRQRSPHELMSAVELVISVMARFSPYSEMMADAHLVQVRQNYARAK
ncbi:hypothetical protein E1B28_005936 [Marasmius oreades]|uniref:Zn(2)-C6 fungal-type domain-containing protein n=1 Tax=Marasmius oreades TaxID=181124 RepID=A0A9P7S4G5_9AGAR|nr:uncharacterized protein E1B28_005936 [Marasmius oreades]KAG7095157.1 hypothetical protein E1B28_005936 [Marasmius oreades]